MRESDLNEFVLANMPHFIAVNYQRLLTTQTPQERVELALHTYNLGLRALTIGLVSQYLIRDKDRVIDPYLNELLLQKFPHLTLDAWQQILFASLRAYEGNQDLFFIPELYNFYWDTSTLPHQRRAEVEQPFNRLTQLAVERQAKRLPPQNEVEWERLAVETLKLLEQILHYWAFIGQYDLIRILNYDEQFYDFELHKGLTISVGRQPLPRQVQFSRGWFYLRKETTEFLLLHPLLVFWEGEVEKSELGLADTGVFDRFVYKHLQYLLATLGKTIIDDKRVIAFVALLYGTIEEAKRPRQEADKLTWWQLRDLCADITRQRMGTVRLKYRRELYLPRDKTRGAFEQFLESDRRCFVLIGKSGVGKSNFLLSLGEELQQSRSDLCLLMYDGAHLNVASSITGVISQDFDDRLILAGRGIQQIWREIAQIEGIEQRLIVLCVDAINENQQAKELLQQLNELVERPWPWLKVVFSSRPETWHAIKRGVKLAEALYYREAGAETLGMELEPFSYSEQMEQFSRQELPAVYAKYRQAFKLQTPYEALPHELRETLRDPLNLWLIAKTYAGLTIPDRLKTTELIEQYVETLLRSERLHEADLRLLTKQLVPLLISEKPYSNAITIADIDAAGGGLYEAIYSEQLLSDGQRLNQSFLNLLDADILVKQVEDRVQKIAFKYERFYEYFVGRHIFALSQTQADRPAFFRELVGEIAEAPFLWGAVKNALVQETKEHNPQIVLQICFTDQQRIKEMMVSVLTELGRDYRIEAENILESLLPPAEKLSKLQSLRQLFSKATVATNVRSRNAKKIAVEVASNLSISQTLHTAALQADSTVRTAAVRYTYYLWQRNQQAGFEVLENLAQSVISGLIPNFLAFESILGLSLVIFFDHPRDEAILKQLQSVWREIIAKILGIQEEGSRWGKFSRKFIRKRAFSFLITIIFRLLRESRISPINYQDLEAFFRVGAKEKALYRKLTRYIDVKGSYSREQMENDFLEVLGVRILLIWGIAFWALMAHTFQDPVNMLPFLKKFFEEAKRDPLPSPYLLDLPWFLFSSQWDRDSVVDEVFDFFVYTLEICHEYYKKHSRIPGMESLDLYGAEAIHLSSYILYQYQRMGTVRTEWLETRINIALSHNNTMFFNRFFEIELPVVGIERRRPRIALEALDLFFNRCSVEIEQMAQYFLARLRVHYPDEVDDFLEEHQVMDEFRLQVQTNEPIETIGQLIGHRSAYFVRDEIIMGSPVLRDQLVSMLLKAADCKDAHEWLDYMLREIINLVYGGEALHRTK